MIASARTDVWNEYDIGDRRDISIFTKSGYCIANRKGTTLKSKLNSFNVIIIVSKTTETSNHNRTNWG